MSFLDYLNRERSGASSYLTPSPSSRSDGLPSLASSSTTSSTPQSIQTPQSVNGELPTVTLPSYSELLARLGNLDMDHAVNRFKSFKPPVDPRLTPPHCAPSFSYSPPRHHPQSGLSCATHHDPHHHQLCRQSHYHTSAPFSDTSPDFSPDSIRLRTVSPAHTHTYECQHANPHTHTHERQWSTAVSTTINNTTSSPSSRDPFYEHEPAGYERIYELDSPGTTATKPKLRRVRREQPMSKSRQAFHATPRTTLKPARSKSAPAKSSSGRAPGPKTKTKTKTKTKRLPSHPMPFYASLFDKGIRNYTGVPRDARDDRENYFSDEQLMEMMPSRYQRWQDAVNRYKPPVLTGDDVDDHDMDDTDGATHPGTEAEELFKSFAIETEKFDKHGVKLWQCEGLFEDDGKTPCRYRQTKQAVKRHINDKHFGFRPWPCPFSNCEKSFKQRTSMNIHAYSRHTGQTPFPCKHCPKEFSDPAQRHDHCKTDHSDMPIMTRKKKAHYSDEDEEPASKDRASAPIQETMDMDVDVDEGYYSDDC